MGAAAEPGRPSTKPGRPATEPGPTSANATISGALTETLTGEEPLPGPHGPPL